MTGIWADHGDGWRLLDTAPYPDEATLHGLVEEAPQMLPLSGSPRLAVVGREVLLGNGYADLLAVEPSGRLAIIEVKLARNAEARRAVVSQVLAYAAYLHRFTVPDLERTVLARHLAQRGFAGILPAAKAVDQEGAVDDGQFQTALESNLREGRFRLVLVLDDAPPELVRLVGYLEAVTDKLVLDLITVRAFNVNGTKIVLPQRVDPERVEVGTETRPAANQPRGEAIDGSDQFEATIELAKPESRELLRKSLAWARGIESRGLVRLITYRGVSDRVTLLPYLLPAGPGLVTIYNDAQSAYFQLWRSVFDKRAPNSVANVEALIAPIRLARGTVVRNIDDRLLDALTKAYEEAAGVVGAASR